MKHLVAIVLAALLIFNVAPAQYGFAPNIEITVDPVQTLGQQSLYRASYDITVRSILFRDSSFAMPSLGVALNVTDIRSIVNFEAYKEISNSTTWFAGIEIGKARYVNSGTNFGAVNLGVRWKFELVTFVVQIRATMLGTGPREFFKFNVGYTIGTF